MKKFFIIINDVQQGPFTLEELRLRGITSDTLVWAEGMTDWTPAWQVDDLKPLLYGSNDTAGATASSPTPPPPSHVTGGQSASGTQGASTSAGAQSTASASAGAQFVDSTHDAFSSRPATAYQPPRHRRVGLVAVIIGAIVLIMLAVTNPSKDEHVAVISTHVTEAMQKTAGGNDSFLGGIIGTMFTQLPITPIIDNALQYHNYLFLSKTTIAIGGKDKTTSIGILGKVFTSDEEQIATAITDALNGNSHVDDEEPADNGYNSSTTTTTTTDENGNTVTETETTTEEADTTSAANAIARTILHEVKKEVKKQIRQQTDSINSKKVEGLIDKAIDFLKGL